MQRVTNGFNSHLTGLDIILKITAAGHLLMGAYCEATHQEDWKSFRRDRNGERMKTT